jgi:hypothetical protein
MTKEREKEPRRPAKKSYRKPQIRSAQFYERKALACAKLEGGPAEQGCAAGFFS